MTDIEKQRRRMRRWKLANRQHLRAYQKRWRKRNRHHIALYQRRWMRKNWDHVLEYSRRRRRAHLEHYRAYSRMMHAKHKARRNAALRLRRKTDHAYAERLRARSRKWAARHRKECCERTQRAYDRMAYNGLRAKVRKRSGGKCELCGVVPKHAPWLATHHRDGNKTNNTLRNLLAVCAPCHGWIHRPTRKHNTISVKQFYRLARYRPIRRAILARSRGRCEMCGAKCPHLNIHHVDGDRSHNDPSNLLALCAPCHWRS